MNVINEKGGTIMAPLFSIHINVVIRKVKDNYPKYVISMTPLAGRQDSDGITHIHLGRFLTEGLG